MPPGFYNPYDQQVYDAGFKYIPQSKYLLNPFQIPTDDSTTTPPDTGGITSLNRGGGGGGGGALQAGNINYGSFSKTGFDAQAARNPTPLVDMTYNQKLQSNFFGLPSFKEQELTGPDMGEYIASKKYDVPLELTRAGKVQQGFQNIGQGITGLADKIGGFGPISAILGSMDKFDTLPELDRQFIEQNMGYRGPTVFGENTGGNYVDPFGVNTRSAFGNYAEKVRDDFSSLGDSLTGRLSEKYGATFNPETGLFESDDEEAAALANKKTTMMRKKYVFRQKQIDQQEMNRKAIEARNRMEAKAAKENQFKQEQERQRQSDQARVDRAYREETGGQGGSYSTGESGQQSDGSYNDPFDPGGGEKDGGFIDGTNRRTYYMNGGLADMLEIYD